MADCGKIRNHPDNPRKVMRNIDELAMSIKEHGLIQPVVVSPDLDRPEGHFLLHAGHRRLAAFRKLGIKQIPATLKNIPASRRTEVMLVENLQRDDLTKMEIGQALLALRDMHDPPLTQAEIARRLGKTQTWVYQMILFTELGDDDEALLEQGEITQAEALEKAKEAKKERGGRVLPKRERADDRPSRGWYLALSHPLAGDARLYCDASGHEKKSGRRIGGVACGACWEAVIRADERGGVDAIDELLAGLHVDYDPVVITNLVNAAHHSFAGNPAEKLEAVRIMLQAGVAERTACLRVGMVNPALQRRTIDDVRRLERARAGSESAVAS